MVSGPVLSKIRRASGPRRVRSRLRCLRCFGTRGLRSYAFIGSLRARKGRRPGGIRRTGTCAAGASTARRRSAEAASRPVILQKSIPKSRSNLEPLLEAKMPPKTSQNEPKNLQKIIEKSMQFSTECLVPFCIDFVLFSQRPDITIYSTVVGCSIFRRGLNINKQVSE